MDKKQHNSPKNTPEWIRALAAIAKTLPTLTDRERLFVEKLVIPHIEKLAFRAFWLTHDQQSAQDLLQDTLLTAWKNFDKYKEQKGSYRWLDTIMTNLYKSHLRKQKRIKEEAGPVLSLEELVPPSQEDEETLLPEEVIEREGDPFDKLALNEISHTIIKALLELPEGMRHVFLLRTIGDFSEQEVMQILGIRKGTVKSRFNRARTLLREKLNKYFNPGKGKLPPWS